jgi:hypothetical protein
LGGGGDVGDCEVQVEAGGGGPMSVPALMQWPRCVSTAYSPVSEQQGASSASANYANINDNRGQDMYQLTMFCQETARCV